MAEFTQQDRLLLDQLVAESACRNLLERYSNIVDWKDWGSLADIIWPDANFDFGLWAGTFSEFVPWVTELEDGYQRRLHLFSIQRIAIDGDQARGEVGMANHLRLQDDHGAAKEDLLFGRYQFRFSKHDGQWRIQGLRFFLHGVQRFDAADDGGAPFFADGLDPSHPHFTH